MCRSGRAGAEGGSEGYQKWRAQTPRSLLRSLRVVQYTPSDTIGKSLISIRTDGQVGSTREKGLSIREMNLISGT